MAMRELLVREFLDKDDAHRPVEFVLVIVFVVIGLAVGMGVLQSQVAQVLAALGRHLV